MSRANYTQPKCDEQNQILWKIKKNIFVLSIKIIDITQIILYSLRRLDNYILSIFRLTSRKYLQTLPL